MAKLVYRAKQGMVCTINGNRVHFSGGDLVLEDHPVKPKNHQNFEEISEYVERISAPRYRGAVIEQATAEPGEKRSIGRTRGSRNKPKETPVEPENAASEAQEEQASDGEE